MKLNDIYHLIYSKIFGLQIYIFLSNIIYSIYDNVTSINTIIYISF